ncbi:DHHA1 domain-containing protein [Deltaproteobacteria bacterium TL4]
MNRALVIYHADCLDGFGAAFAIHKHFQNSHASQCEFHGAYHGTEPPAIEGRELYLVDFSYKRTVLKKLCAQSKRVTIIDHHISTQQDLSGLDQEIENLTVHFDMKQSGAVMTWKLFHSTPPPSLLLHIQDLDLWNFQLEGTQDITSALMSYPYDFEQWTQLMVDDRLVLLRTEGEAINRYRQQMIEVHKRKVVIANIAGYQVPVVNCPGVILSDLVGELAKDYPFAAGYQDIGTQRKWSLRSRGEEGLDVAKMAEQFGGGGHRNAAGFQTELPESLLSVQPPTATI